MLSDNWNKFKITYNKNLKISPIFRNWITCLNNLLVKDGMMKEIRKYFRLNHNKYTTYQTLQCESKEVLRGKFITLNACN